MVEDHVRVAGRRIAWTVAALAVNAFGVATSAYDDPGPLAVVCVIAALPALLFLFRRDDRAYRRAAGVVAAIYVALMAASLWFLGFLPAAVCMLAAALSRRR